MGSKDVHPPSNYHEIDLQTVVLPAGDFIYRCSNSEYGKNGAIHFVKDTREDKNRSGRFGDLNMDIGVCYFGYSLAASLVETLLQVGGYVDVIPEADLYAKSLTQIHAKRDLTLVQFYGEGLYSNKADAAITSQNHMSSRLWSTQIMSHPNNYDGIIWRSVIDNDLFSIVLFERVKDDLDIDNSCYFKNLNDRDVINHVVEILVSHGVDLI